MKFRIEMLSFLFLVTISGISNPSFLLPKSHKSSEKSLCDSYIINSNINIIYTSLCSTLPTKSLPIPYSSHSNLWCLKLMVSKLLASEWWNSLWVDKHYGIVCLFALYKDIPIFHLKHNILPEIKLLVLFNCHDGNLTLPGKHSSTEIHIQILV